MQHWFKNNLKKGCSSQNFLFFFLQQSWNRPTEARTSASSVTARWKTRTARLGRDRWGDLLFITERAQKERGWTCDSNTQAPSTPRRQSADGRDDSTPRKPLSSPSRAASTPTRSGLSENRWGGGGERGVVPIWTRQRSARLTAACFQGREEEEAADLREWPDGGLPQGERLLQVSPAAGSLNGSTCRRFTHRKQTGSFLVPLATTRRLRTHPGSSCWAAKTSWSRRRRTGAQVDRRLRASAEVMLCSVV